MAELEAGGKLELVVISLASAGERRRRVEASMRELSLPWSLFEARSTLPATLAYDENKARIHRGRALRPGELGAFGSHYECLREFVERSTAEYRLIVEDDVFLDPGFPYVRLPALMSACGIEYLRLHATFLRPGSLIAHLGKYRQLVRFRAPTFGACAYVVSKSGASRFLASVREVVRPVDDELDRFWHNGLPAYAIHPGPALELFGQTTLGDPAKTSETPGFVARGRHGLARLGEWLRCQAANAGLRARDRRIGRVAKALAAKKAL